METFTFYSYKGGTGRSLLLANAARYLALLGKRVVALDFDFEAPGLHYKLNIGGPGVRTADVVPERGVVDYLLAATEGETSLERLRDYVVPVPLPQGCAGELHLMPAGAAPSGDYWKRLSTLLRREVFADPEGSGLAACLELKARMEEELHADVLLLDSRTGITELSGVTTTILADKVVCLLLNNRESLTGTRAVLRSLRHAPRLRGQAPIEVLPVLSRVPEHDEAGGRQVLRFLNEDGPTPEDTLALHKIFELRSDPELARIEKLHVGSGEPARQSALHQDYLALLAQLVSADPERISAATRRQEAVHAARSWLTDSPETRRHHWHGPEGFREEQIDEGVTFGTHETRYADLVAYAGRDRSEALLAVEYVDDLAGSDAWRWWEAKTNLRCAVLVGRKGDNGYYFERRVFTRGRRSQTFTERDDFAGWAVRWPLSFSAMEDPGDRSAASMLAAVQRGADEYISLLVTEFQHSSFVTLHGGAPFRPALARQIVDGLARVHNKETETHILWRTAPDPHEGSDEGMGDRVALEELTTRELHAPLWWRVSAEAKMEFWRQPRGPHGGRCLAGIDLLARDLMGLVLDQDRDFRREVRPLLVPPEGDDGDPGARRLVDLFAQGELKFELSEETPPELVRRATLLRALQGNRGVGLSAASLREGGEHDAGEALHDSRRLAVLLRAQDGRLDLPTTNLLGLYDPASAQVTLYRPLVDWCARALDLDARALGNVVFMHESVHAICHLGRDLDERAWDDFALPSSLNPAFRPSAFHEGLAQYFTLRLIERLGDTEMMTALERLSDHQPAEYQAWRKLRTFSVERVRAVLLRARAGLDDTSLFIP